ncbi:MAG: hypothetical protein RLZZ568_744, partial [Cyanobacteriota bacterium]
MSDLQMGTLLSNRYHIQSLLGSGGFGVTYLARDLQLPGHPECVVKRLKINSQDSQVFSIARRLFDKEAITLQKLGQHNQIPRLLAHFEQDKEFYLVLDYVEGEDLNNKLINFDERKTLLLIREVLEVLRFVHEAHVIHRDIKPSNLMRRKIDGKLVIIDFGAVKEIENQATIIETKGTTQTICIGTPGYIPLEQMGGDPRYNSDIFA